MANEAIEAYLSFMEEYAGFYEETVRHEEEKQADLKSNQLKRIEQALSRQQAALMAMSNLEKRRDALQAEAGFGQGDDFQEIASRLDGGERERFQQAVDRLRSAIVELRERNAKSMELAQDRLDVLSSVLPEAGRETYSPYTKKGPEHGKPTLFNSKI